MSLYRELKELKQSVSDVRNNIFNNLESSQITGSIGLFTQLTSSLLKATQLTSSYTLATQLTATYGDVTVLTASTLKTNTGLISVSQLTASSAIISNNLVCSGNVLMRSTYGIDFGANTSAAGMTSELFDDYEEGTWTPSYSGSSVAGTITYTQRAGYYTKIGRKVFVQGVIVVATEASTAGNLSITGLPFTIDNSNYHYPSFHVSTFFNWDASLSAYAINLEGDTNTTNISVFKVTAASNTQGTRAQGSDLAATGNNITFSGFYFTSS